MMKLLTQWAVTSSVLILIVLAVRYLFRDKLSARLRCPNQPSSITSISIPNPAASPAMERSFSVLKSK